MTQNERDIKDWLTDQKKFARPWPQFALISGTVLAFLVILQALCLAKILSGFLFEHRSVQELSIFLMGFPTIVIGRALVNWLKDAAGSKASGRVRLQVRSSLVVKLEELGPAWKSRQRSGSLLSKLLEQVDSLDAFFSRFIPQQFLASIVPSIIILVTTSLNWAVGLIFFITLPLIPGFMILIGYGAQAEQTKQFKALSRMSGHFLDTIRGLTTLRLLAAEKRQESTMDNVNENFRLRTMKVLRLAFLSSAVLEFFASVAVALTATYLGFSLLGVLDFGSWGGKLDYFQALFILLLTPEFYLPLRELGILYHARAEAQAASGQILPILKESSPQPLGGVSQPGLGPPDLSFIGVDFSYVPDVPVLKNFSFEMKAGESIAFVGASGAGKTTLLRLLLGHVEPTSGTIFVGGQKLLDLDLSLWRKKIGWMSQHPRLIAGTLEENLRVAAPDAENRDLLEAIDFAGLMDWFDQLPQGLKTHIGDGGRQLSGGQLRRLALARVMLRKADLILLDEPTASLDVGTQDLVLSRLPILKRQSTMILLTHHPKPLAVVDRVAWLENGSVPQVFSPHEAASLVEDRQEEFE